MKLFDRIGNAITAFRNADTGNPVDALLPNKYTPIGQLTPTRNVSIYALGNPMISLTPQLAADMLNRTWYGEFTRVQWVMMWAEKIDPDIMAITNRLTAALRTMDYGVQVKSQEDETLKAMALKQKLALEAKYEKVKGIKKAVTLKKMSCVILVVPIQKDTVKPCA